MGVDKSMIKSVEKEVFLTKKEGVYNWNSRD